MIPVYSPADFQIGFGIPGTPAYAVISDWTSLVEAPQAQMFTGSKGILGEPFLEMSTDSSKRFTLTLLQSSKDVEDMHNIFLAQRIGFLGLPFSIIDNGTDSNVDQGRLKSGYPVGVIENEAPRDFGLDGKGWVYTIWTPSGISAYI